MPDLYDNPVVLAHGRVKLALHMLREAKGPTLLLLHGLGHRSPKAVPGWAESWPGSVHALDFTGHGESTRPRGGGYTAEILMGDADAALARLGPCTVVGHGLGAYIALLLAGARPVAVRGAILCDGVGLIGGPTDSFAPVLYQVAEAEPVDGAPDPWALVELNSDPRPPDYSTMFARLAVSRSTVDPAIAVAAKVRPAWLAAVAAEPGVVEMSLETALATYAANR
jgi:pimeloyl-ACP methyl ester carboxylesterase